MPSLLAETGRLSNIRLTLLRRGHIYGGGRLSFRAPILSSSIMEPTDQSQDGKKYTLPSDFLSRPAPNLTVQKIDFSKTSLPQYGALYATVIDNALSEEECKALVRAAEAHADGKWEQAMVNVGLGRQKLISDVRDCGRIIWDDATVVDKIWSRISSSVPELKLIENAARVTGYGPVKRGETYQMTRLNERMRFLKYGSGQYFRRKPGPYFPPNSSISYPSTHPPPKSHSIQQQQKKKDREKNQPTNQPTNKPKPKKNSPPRRQLHNPRRPRTLLLHPPPLPQRIQPRHQPPPRRRHHFSFLRHEPHPRRRPQGRSRALVPASRSGSFGR